MSVEVAKVGVGFQTAKANQPEPYQYLRHVFTELPKADAVEAIEALLPANIDVDTIYC